MDGTPKVILKSAMRIGKTVVTMHSHEITSRELNAIMQGALKLP